MRFRNLILIISFVLISGCVGYSSTGVLGTGVSVAMDPRTIGTQIDDSIMQKTISSKIIAKDKKYVGEWKNGKMHGEGVLNFNDGRVFKVHCK